MRQTKPGRSNRPFALSAVSVVILLGISAVACHPGGQSKISIGGSPTPSGSPSGTATPGGTPIALGALDVPMHVEELAGVDRASEPVRSGVPMPRDLNLTDPSLLVVTDATGAIVPSQLRVTSRWGGTPDDATKPIKWVLVDFQASVSAGGATDFHLRAAKQPVPQTGSLVATDASDHLTIDTGAAKFTVSKTHFDLLDGVTLANGTQLVASDPTSGAVLTTPDGTRFTASATTTVAVEEDGPLHAVVVAKGKHKSSTGTLLDFTVRLHFWKGRPDCLVSYTFTDRDLLHIGDYDAVSEVALTTPASVGAHPRYAIGGEQSDASGALGAEAWQHQTGNLDEAMGATYNPGTADAITWSEGGSASGTGGHAPGWIDLSGDAGGITAAVRWYWQQYPKKLDATPDRLTVDLWPKEDVPMRVYAAAQKTHEVLYTFHDAQASASAIGHDDAARLAEPLFARCDPEWYASTWVWDRLGTANPNDYPAANRAVVAQYFSNLKNVEYQQTFVERRYDAAGRGHEYSMWDFGDAREDQWSNLAYDTPRSLFLQFAMTGDRDYFDRGLEAAQHLRDVDIEHSPQDTRAGIHPNRGVPEPWLGRTRYNPTRGPQSHDLGYTGATGYGFEHHKGEGLADHYFLTGDMLSKEVLAESYHYYQQWLVDAQSGYQMTDGTRVVSHMLLVVLGYYDAYGTDEARQRADYIVNYLNTWQRKTTSRDPNGWMWMSTVNDNTASWMNGITMESMMLYELMFPNGVPVRQNLIDAAKYLVDPNSGMLQKGPVGHYFNAWTDDNYGITHATCLDPMMLAGLSYAGAATGDSSYLTLSKELLSNAITQDTSSPLVKSFTQQTRLVPAFLWFLETPGAQQEAATQPGS